MTREAYIAEIKQRAIPLNRSGFELLYRSKLHGIFCPVGRMLSGNSQDLVVGMLLTSRTPGIVGEAVICIGDDYYLLYSGAREWQLDVIRNQEPPYESRPVAQKRKRERRFPPRATGVASANAFAQEMQQVYRLQTGQRTELLSDAVYAYSRQRQPEIEHSAAGTTVRTFRGQFRFPDLFDPATAHAYDVVAIAIVTLKNGSVELWPVLTEHVAVSQQLTAYYRLLGSEARSIRVAAVRHHYSPQQPDQLHCPETYLMNQAASNRPRTTVDLFGEEFEISIKEEQYASGDRVALVAVEADGSPFGSITVNIPEHELEPGEILVRTYSEHAWVSQLLQKLPERFQDTGKRVACGHAQAHVWRYVRPNE